MAIQIPPTRMAFLNLKRKRKSLAQGHKLLKNKLDGMTMVFLSKIHEVQKLRQKAMNELGEVWKLQLLATNLNDTKFTEGALSHASGGKNLTVNVKTKKTMGVALSEFKTEDIKVKIDYGTGQTSAILDQAAKKLAESIPTLLRLAELEKQLQNLAVEMQATRQRTNALEHIKIPQADATLKYISMALDEADRSEKIRIMVMNDYSE